MKKVVSLVLMALLVTNVMGATTISAKGIDKSNEIELKDSKQTDKKKKEDKEKELKEKKEKELKEKKEKELKERLIKIMENDITIPEDTTAYKLACEMMESIGSTDPELRDELILSILWNMMLSEKLSDKEAKAITKLALSENYLMYNIGSPEDDSVFKRSFSVLVGSLGLYRNYSAEKKIFSDEEMKEMHGQIIEYAKQEKDLRGYVEEKGWAHSAAHTGDALTQLAYSPQICKEELIEILDVIRGKILTNDYTYINGEPERLVSAVMGVVEGKVVSNKEIIEWINDFKDMDKTGEYPKDYNIDTNQSSFLTALYFRIKKSAQNDEVDNPEELLKAIEDVIMATNSFLQY